MFLFSEKNLIQLFQGICIMALFVACDQPQDHPNVLLILTDDQGYGDMHLHQNDSISTPVLDQLAQSGARFDRFLVSPVCAPTRASLLTGRYHLRTGTYWVTRGGETMRTEEFTLAELFKASGYRTGCFGKWHNGAHYPNHPLDQGFDEFLGFCAGHLNNYFDPVLEKGRDSMETSGYIADIFTDAALEFMQADRTTPFFCYVPYNTPHTPYQVPDAYFNKYEQSLGISDSLERHRRASIYGMVENIDDNIGRLLHYLDTSGRREETMVLFLTDNGPNGWRYNGNMRGKKAWVTEGGVRVPFFISWPGQIPGNKLVNQLAGHIDVLPTLASLASLPLPNDLALDGWDLSAHLISETEPEDRMLFTHQASGIGLFPGKGAVRTSRYRLNVGMSDQPELFDMWQDPEEEQNIYKLFPKLGDSLHRAYRNWLEEVTETWQEAPPPIVVGATPHAILPAHEAMLSKGLTYQASRFGWAHDWIIQWDETSDTLSWPIHVEQNGDYMIYARYTVAPEDTGSHIKIMAPSDSLVWEVTQSFNPEPLPTFDRVKRSAEAHDKPWQAFAAGTITLDSGMQQIRMAASQIPGQQVLELKELIFRKK